MMAINHSPTDSLRGKLENLAIGGTSEILDPPQVESRATQSTQSLLSKRLANERRREHPSFDAEEKTREYVDTEGHPEPSLLATSFGNDHHGRLIPSSSTISLLSLSNNVGGSQLLASQPEVPNFGNKGVMSSPSGPSGPSGHPSGLPQGIGSGMANFTNLERVTSHTNLRSRNSITHLGHQRLQPYQNISSPVVPMSGDFNSISSPKVIPWGKGRSAVPDSPNLHPTSIDESPSQFWLNAQSPPQILTNPGRQRGSVSGLAGLTITPYHLVNSDKHVRPQAINIKNGHDSPRLNPVQTPLEAMPMTPLYLNSEAGYFLSAHGPREVSHLDDQHDREQFQCETDDPLMH